ncbi:dihydrolipoyl dehydrogenase [Mycoplasmopsis caviae]|uniref:Dihydrolipoyl dehydrogenase n=1 Tax=Mycoplasmopsis caviae TaxID=55603 RepID=A0A3P8LAF5_9BACT|nr:dihydrolipoyl dehydrogenase [Mycoplasmopsis caviae]UUD35538.1 dihydrolipoyl dehydrogenase [Mycoplasmopsis caviae]VDR41691.1 pyruvate dehydrogenase E2 component [Mycoplasmopsis caviae]
MYIFKFADIGEGLHEGTVGEIPIKIGDKVKEGQTLFSVETDKVASEIPSPVDGIIKEIRMKSGDVIHVGQEIIVIDDGKGTSVETPVVKNETTSNSTTSYYVFKFADIGEGLHEGTVGEIPIKIGDKVKEGQKLFSVETDKVASEIPSPVDGIVKEIRMKSGDLIHVGQEIIVIDAGDKNPTTSFATNTVKKETEEEKCLVGDAPNSSELIDLNFDSLSASTSAVEVDKVEIQTPSYESIDDEDSISFSTEGKKYDGKVDEEFDVVIIGGGPGGYLAAEELGKAGKKILIVEKEFWGGVCLNIGCIPTKAMLKSTDVLETVLNAASYGVVGNLDKLKIDLQKTWVKMHERKKGVVDQISSSVKKLMIASKCKIEEGEAEFVGAREIKVNNKVYRGKNVILATGSHSRRLRALPGFKAGYEKNYVLSSREAINYDSKLPSSIVIVGGGVVGVEFAQVFASAGSKVTIIQNQNHLLPGIDHDVTNEIVKHLEKHGVQIIYNATSTGLSNKNELVYEIGGTERKIKADVYLIAVGRIPSSQGLAEIGVNVGVREEVPVDEKMRTNVKNVYAIGDLTGQNMLAHVAYQHALIAVGNILGENVRYHNKPVPGCIYTNPEIAFIGLTEEEAKEKGHNVFISKYLFSFLGKAIATKQTSGFVKLIVDREYGQILGAHIIGAHATDYISEIALAMEQEVSVKEIAYTIHPHPTYSEIIWEAARSAALKLYLEEHKK